MKYEIFTAFRYLRSKKDNLFISKLLIISIITVTVAITVPIIVISVINGFHSSIEEKIIGSSFQVRIRHKYDHFESYRSVIKSLKQNKNIELIIPFFERQGLIKVRGGNAIFSVTVKAFYNKDILKNNLFLKNFKFLPDEEIPYYDALEFDISKDSELDKSNVELEQKGIKTSRAKAKIIESLIVKNKLKAQDKVSDLTQKSIAEIREDRINPFQIEEGNNIVIGDALCRYLQVSKHNKIQLLIPQGDIQLDSDPENIKSLNVSAVYSAGYAKFNKALVFINFKSLKQVFHLRESPTDIGLNFKSEIDYNEFKSQLIKQFPDLEVTSTLEEGIFKDFTQEKKMMNLLLYFLIFSAFLTIYIALHVVVMDKKKEIGILKAIGSKIKSIQMIFIIEGLMVSLTGVLLGNLLGILITTSLTEIVHFLENSCNTVLNLTFIFAGDAFDLDYPAPCYIMDPNVFYLNTFPYRFNYLDILLQSVGAIFVATLAAYFPSKRASMQKVSESLKV